MGAAWEGLRRKRRKKRRKRRRRRCRRRRRRSRPRRGIIKYRSYLVVIWQLLVVMLPHACRYLPLHRTQRLVPGGAICTTHSHSCVLEEVSLSCDRRLEFGRTDMFGAFPPSQTVSQGNQQSLSLSLSPISPIGILTLCSANLAEAAKAKLQPASQPPPVAELFELSRGLLLARGACAFPSKCPKRDSNLRSMPPAQAPAAAAAPAAAPAAPVPPVQPVPSQPAQPPAWRGLRLSQSGLLMAFGFPFVL